MKERARYVRARGEGGGLELCPATCIVDMKRNQRFDGNIIQNYLIFYHHVKHWYNRCQLAKQEIDNFFASDLQFRCYSLWFAFSL